MPLLGFKLSKVIPKDLLIDNKSSINTDSMNFLSIDCSTDIGSLFLKTKSKSFSKILQSDKSNIDLLVMNILDFFNENKVDFKDISEILVNQGPGNFSSLRGSLAVAKGLSLAKNLKLFGYNTFIWSCSKFIKQKGTIYSLIKFRGKYFVKKFDKNLTVISKTEKITEEEIIKKCNSNFKVITTSNAKDFDKNILKLGNINIVDLDHNNLELLQLKGFLNKDMIKPLYLS